MGKILIIGVGGAGENIVRRMKEVGISNANYITIGGGTISEESDIPYYSLMSLNGIGVMPAGSKPQLWRELAENAKEEIGEIIDANLM